MQDGHVNKLVRDDLLTLGVDVDSGIIERMRFLGLDNSWATASRAANSLRKRNPNGVPSSVAYQNIVRPRENVRIEQQELDKEWSNVDTSRVHRVLHKLYEPSSNLKRSVCIGVLKMIQIFKTQYSRSPDHFIDLMLDSKNEKGLIRVDNMSRSRYVNCEQFVATIARLSRRQGYTIEATALFEMLSENNATDYRKGNVDLKAFLLLIEIADGDEFRKVDNKASRAALSIEFWIRRQSAEI